MPAHPLTNFKIRKHYQNEVECNGVFSINNLPKINNGTYVVNLDEYISIGPRWIALYVDGDNVIYFDSFGVEYTPKEIKKSISKKSIKTNIYRIQANDSIMCRYFSIGFINVVLKGKSWLDYTNLFSSNTYEKNDTIILKY